MKLSSPPPRSTCPRIEGVSVVEMGALILGRAGISTTSALPLSRIRFIVEHSISLQIAQSWGFGISQCPESGVQTLVMCESDGR